jgi:hypothetical protein
MLLTMKRLVQNQDSGQIKEKIFASSTLTLEKI